MDFPNVPNLPGVPSLLRIPAGAFNVVGQGLDVTANIMSTVRALSRTNPLTALSHIAPDISEATGLMASVQGTIGNYASSILGQFAGPSAGISAGLSTLTNAITITPNNPISSMGSTIDSTALLSDATAVDFADATSEPAVDGVESVTVTATRGGPQWGIFKDGQSVIKADSVGEFGVKKEWTISDYPVEEGAFQSYNKVYVPFDARIQFRAGGSVDNRQALLDSIEAIAGDLLLYDAVMPEKTYQSVNVVHYDLRRQYDKGLGILIIDVYLEEVRDTADAEFTSAAADTSTEGAPASQAKTPKSPTAAAKKSSGPKQAKAATPTQGAAINAALNAIVPAL